MLALDDRDRLTAGLADPDQVAALKGPAPCDDCPRAARCAAHELACAAFSLFVSGESQVRWDVAPRAPERHTFERIFADQRRTPDASEGLTRRAATAWLRAHGVEIADSGLASLAHQLTGPTYAVRTFGELPVAVYQEAALCAWLDAHENPWS